MHHADQFDVAAEGFDDVHSDLCASDRDQFCVAAELFCDADRSDRSVEEEPVRCGAIVVAAPDNPQRELKRKLESLQRQMRRNTQIVQDLRKDLKSTRKQ